MVRPRWAALFFGLALFPASRASAQFEGSFSLPPAPPTPPSSCYGCDNGGTRGDGNSAYRQRVEEENARIDEENARIDQSNALIGTGEDTAGAALDAIKTADAASGAARNAGYASAISYLQQTIDYFQQADRISALNKYAAHEIVWAGAVIAHLRGVMAFEAGDYAGALAFWQQAMAMDDQKIYRDNIGRAQAALNKQRDDAAHQAAVSNSVNGLVQSARSAPGSAPGLQFMAPGSDLKDAVADSPTDISTGSCLLGGSCGPANPDLKTRTKTDRPGSDFKALDQASAMAETSKQGEHATSAEDAAALAGTTPTDGGKIAGQSQVNFGGRDIQQKPEPPLPPALAAALAKDPAYVKLGEDRAKAQKDADDAQKQLTVLAEKQRSAPPKEKAIIQVQMAEVTQKLNAATSTVRTDDIKADAIKTNYVTKITMLPAPAKPAPAAKANAP